MPNSATPAECFDVVVTLRHLLAVGAGAPTILMLRSIPIIEFEPNVARQRSLIWHRAHCVASLHSVLGIHDNAHHMSRKLTAGLVVPENGPAIAQVPVLLIYLSFLSPAIGSRIFSCLLSNQYVRRLLRQVIGHDIVLVTVWLFVGGVPQQLKAWLFRSHWVGENGVAWPVGLLDQPHISHSWQSGENIYYYGSIHLHEGFLEKKYRYPVPFSILIL